MSIGLGVGVFIAGLVIITLALLMLRLVARTHSDPQESLASPVLTKSNSRDAVIVIQPGGRVEYLSAAARPYFNLREDEPFDLERLARHV
ncbi:MAG TPA: hypothetical protein PLL95_18170, partial [Anaerolineales bacterium]|nr:hypothetical protein [Anaerolineales bacterium]